MSLDSMTFDIEFLLKLKRCYSKYRRNKLPRCYFFLSNQKKAGISGLISVLWFTVRLTESMRLWQRCSSDLNVKQEDYFCLLCKIQYFNFVAAASVCVSVCGGDVLYGRCAGSCWLMQYSAVCPTHWIMGNALIDCLWTNRATWQHPTRLKQTTYERTSGILWPSMCPCAS